MFYTSDRSQSTCYILVDLEAAIMTSGGRLKSYDCAVSNAHLIQWNVLNALGRFCSTYERLQVIQSDQENLFYSLKNGNLESKYILALTGNYMYHIITKKAERLNDIMAY